LLYYRETLAEICSYCQGRSLRRRLTNMLIERGCKERQLCMGDWLSDANDSSFRISFCQCFVLGV